MAFHPGAFWASRDLLSVASRGWTRMVLPSLEPVQWARKGQPAHRDPNLARPPPSCVGAIATTWPAGHRTVLPSVSMANCSFEYMPVGAGRCRRGLHFDVRLDAGGLEPLDHLSCAVRAVAVCLRASRPVGLGAVAQHVRQQGLGYRSVCRIAWSHLGLNDDLRVGVDGDVALCSHRTSGPPSCGRGAPPGPPSRSPDPVLLAARCGTDPSSRCSRSWPMTVATRAADCFTAVGRSRPSRHSKTACASRAKASTKASRAAGSSQSQAGLPAEM